MLNNALKHWDDKWSWHLFGCYSPHKRVNKNAFNFILENICMPKKGLQLS